MWIQSYVEKVETYYEAGKTEHLNGSEHGYINSTKINSMRYVVLKISWLKQIQQFRPAQFSFAGLQYLRLRQDSKHGHHLFRTFLDAVFFDLQFVFCLPCYSKHFNWHTVWLATIQNSTSTFVLPVSSITETTS